MSRRAIFFDRDGVLNRNIPGGYVTRPEEYEWLPNGRAALRLAHAQGWTCIVVTNQAGTGKGLVTERNLDASHARMRVEAAAAGSDIAGIYVCPHVPADDCPCRKPRPALILRAGADLDIDLNVSWLIGDAASDVQMSAH